MPVKIGLVSCDAMPISQSIATRVIDKDIKADRGVPACNPREKPTVLPCPDQRGLTIGPATTPNLSAPGIAQSPRTRNAAFSIQKGPHSFIFYTSLRVSTNKSVQDLVSERLTPALGTHAQTHLPR
jgi:hypothetical protein